VSQPSATLPEGERETPPPQAPASLFERLRPHFPWLLFAAALALRLWGIGWGLPDDKRHWSYHPDEPVLYAYSQQIEPAKLDFEPGFYNYGTLYLTLLRVTSDVARTYSNAGPVEGGEPQIWMEMRTAHLGGRIVSALAGAGTAVVLFLMLRRRLGDPAALAGALVVAFAPGHVVHSRFQTVDVLAAFFLSLSALFALRLLPGGKKEAEDPPQPAAAMRQALWCGVFAGLSAGTKYTGILGLFTLFAAAAYLPRGRRLAPALAGAGAALAVFLLATPGAFLNSAKFLEDFRYEMQHTSQGHGLVFAGLPSGFFWHLYNLVIGVGPLLVLLGLGGAGAALRKGHPEAFALAAFALPYYLLIGRAEVLFLRYTFPLLILLAFGVAWLVRWSSDRGGAARWLPAFVIAGLGGLLGGGLASSAVSGVWMSQPDPRDQVQTLLQGKEGTVGLVSDPWYYTPPFYPETGAPRWIPFEARHRLMLEAESPSLARFLPENPAERFDWDVRLLDQEPEFVVFSSFETEGYDRLRILPNLQPEPKLHVERFVAFYERLKSEYELEATFGETRAAGGRIDLAFGGVHDLMYVRPLMWIWKRKAAP
jgi:hypothetical protein